MIEIKYEDLKKVKEFEDKGDYLIYSFSIDEFMGFTICRIKAYEREDGFTDIIFTDQYIMSGHSKETETTDERFIKIMKNRLIRLIGKNKIG